MKKLIVFILSLSVIAIAQAISEVNLNRNSLK